MAEGNKENQLITESLCLTCSIDTSRILRNKRKQIFH